MRVEKWYLDCVTPDGAGLIGYAVRIGWGPFAVKCAETLQWTDIAQFPQQRIALGGPLPVAGAERIVWRCPALRASGTWVPLAPGLGAMVLHEDATGRIEWNCLCPAAQVQAFAADRPCEGLGYAEQLILTVPAGALPFHELRWGRFVGAGVNCVWIRWRQPAERCWCFHNGAPVGAEMRDDGQLVWPGHRLELEPGSTLRHGRLADTAFAHAKWLQRFLPSRVAGIQETKWCSRGVLTDQAGRRHEGWAIHENALLP